jgi:RNA recognition motif-containing protein
LSEKFRQDKPNRRRLLKLISLFYDLSNKGEESPMPKLFIGNIPNASSDDELQQWVETQGFQVESAQIIRDRSTGQSRGFGFVVIKETTKARDAISALNGQRMGGRVLSVNEALPQAQRSDENEYRPDTNS